LQTSVVANIFACCFALFLCQTHELITVVKADQTFSINQSILYSTELDLRS